MKTIEYPYALVVRWPVGGIRTHLKYSKELLSSDSPVFRPLYISYDDADTQLALSSLNIAPENNFSTGIHSLFGMLKSVVSVCLKKPIRVIHSQGFISSIISTPAAVLFRKKHIVSVHDVITDEVIANTSALSRIVLGAALRMAFAVHAVGQDCANSIRRLPFMRTARNIVIIRNGIDPKRFSNPVPFDLRALTGASADTRLVGFFGRFHPQKGFRYLVDAIAQLRQSHPELSLKVVAVGDAGTLVEDKRYVLDNGLENYFFFHPQVENPTSLMVACDMIVMPSLWEAYSLLAAEVLTLGVPLLASTCIGLAEVVQDSPAKTFPPKNASALAEAIYDEAVHPSKEGALAFMPQARTRFDFTANAEKLNKLLYIAQSGQRLDLL